MRTMQWTCLLFLLILRVAPSLQQTRTNLDLVYVLDGSDSVGRANFELAKQSILNFVLPKMTGNLHVGYVHYSTARNNYIDLTSDPAQFQRLLEQDQFVGGETNTNVGIQWGLSVLMTSSSQPGASKMMVVIVNGISRFPNDTKNVAEFTGGMGVEVVAIGVGNSVPQQELTNIAGSNVLRTDSFAALPAVSLRLSETSEVTTTSRSTTPAPTTTTTTTPRPTTTPRTIPTTTTTTPRTIPTTPRTIPTTTTTTPRTTTPRPTPSRTTTGRPTPRSTTPSRTLPSTTQRPVTTTQRPVITTTRTTTPRVTTTTRRAPVTQYVEPFLDEGLCEDAVVVAGVGYRAHPTDADKYVQCYFPSESRTVAVVRECPFGLLWNHKTRYCDIYLRVRLASDPCEMGQLQAHPHEGNCRTFYSCVNGRSVPQCCPLGYLFDAPSQKCQPCNACTDACPALCSDIQFACTKYPVIGDLTVYRKWTKTGDVIVPCENGTLFDLTACECVDFKIPSVCTSDVDVPLGVGATGTGGSGVNQMTYEYNDVTFTGSAGRFDGVKSRVKIRTMPQSPFDRPVVMRLTYRETANITGPVALASTGRCEFGGLVLMSLERGGIKIEMSSYGHTPIIFRLPTSGFKAEDVKELMFYHDREYLTVVASSGRLVYMRRAKVAVLPYLQCGLDVGNSNWMDGFNGTMSRVQFLRCSPPDFRIY